MKLLAAIMSIWVLLLTTVPCCAYEQKCNKTETSKEHKEHKEDDCENDGCEICSPFFCHCCAHVLITPKIELEIKHIGIDNKISHKSRTVNLVQQFVSALWQPPDLV